MCCKDDCVVFSIARNSWIFNATKMTELEVVQEALGEWLEFRAGQKKQQKENGSRVMMSMAVSGDPGSVKLNVSSSWEEGGKGVGLGIIARNDTGTVLQAWSVARDAIINPVVDETDAVRVALLVAGGL